MLLETAVPLSSMFGSEFLGTMVMVMMGTGTVANITFHKTKGYNAGTLFVNFGWALGVMTGVFLAYKTGAHLNPSVTLGLWAAGKDLAPGIPANLTNILVYIAGQFAGAFIGAIVAWLAYKQYYDDPDVDPAAKLGTFSTAPGIRSYGWNFLSEAIATWVLLMWVLISGFTNVATFDIHSGHISGSLIGPLGIFFLLLGIGSALGGPTGWSLNAARDFAPRVAHAILPIKHKGGSDWGYAWVAAFGPLAGALVAGLTYQIFWNWI